MFVVALFGFEGSIFNESQWGTMGTETFPEFEDNRQYKKVLVSPDKALCDTPPEFSKAISFQPIPIWMEACTSLQRDPRKSIGQTES